MIFTRSLTLLAVIACIYAMELTVYPGELEPQVASFFQDRERFYKKYFGEPDAKCKEAHNVTDLALLEAVITDNITEHIKCYTRCVQKEANLFKDGEFQRQSLIDMMSEAVSVEDATMVVDKCMSIRQVEDSCDYVYQVYDCYRKEFGAIMLKELRKISTRY